MSNQRPFFSVITSFFNSEKYLYKYISKLQDQTFLNWECILIDDYSEDNGYEKVSELIKNDGRIKLYKNKLKKEIKGPYQGRNYGLDLAVGEFICFLDIDDYWNKYMLEIKYNFLIENKNIDIIFTNYFRCKKNFQEIIKPITIVPLKFQLRFHNPIGMLTSSVRRNAINNQKFKSLNHEDYIFWAEIIRDNPSLKIKYLNLELAYYCISEESLSSKKLFAIKWHYKCYLELGYSNFLAIICFIPLLTFKSIVFFKRNFLNKKVKIENL